jgi:hypothetical protein
MLLWVSGTTQDSLCVTCLSLPSDVKADVSLEGKASAQSLLTSYCRFCWHRTERIRMIMLPSSGPKSTQFFRNFDNDSYFDTDNILHQGRKNPGRQVAMTPRKFVVAPCTFDSNYSWFIYVFPVLKFPSEYDCVTHLVILN